ncbi:MAG: hypothetical protein ABIN15_03495 [candidate division WOR-3 bacterium]
MKKIFFLIFILFYFCERKVETIREIVFPEGPFIVESVLCTKVVNGNPYGITNQFFLGDTVNLWIYWMGMKGKHKISCFWVKPYGQDFARDSILVDSDSTKLITVFSVVTRSYDPQGEWSCEIYLDKKFQRGLLFYLSQ